MDDDGGNTTGASLGGYISYAHADARMVERLMIHLRGHVWSGPRIDFWTDTEIKPGVAWNEQIANAIDNADVFLSCASPDYLYSAFIQDSELPRIEQRVRAVGALRIPVILKPCAWYGFAGLFQAVPAVDGRVRPISGWRTRDDGFHAAAAQIVEAVHHHFTTSADRDLLMQLDKFVDPIGHLPFAPERDDRLPDHGTRRTGPTARRQRTIQAEG